MPETNIDNLDSPEEDKDKETDGEEKEGEEKEWEELEGEGEFVLPEKFKGKSPEEIARSYVELEKMIDKKAEEKAKVLAVESSEEGEDIKKPEKKETTPIENLDFSTMTPEKFADWVRQEIDQRAEAKAKEIYESSDSLKRTVSTEITEAQEKFPILKENTQFRELVLAMVEATAAKGKSIKLQDACKKVSDLIGGIKKPGPTEEEKMKKARAIVEKTGGGTQGGDAATEEEQIKKGILGGGGKSALGGLGF